MCIVIVPPVWGEVSLSLVKLVSYKHVCCSIWGALWGPQIGSEYLVVMWKSRGMIKEFTSVPHLFLRNDWHLAQYLTSVLKSTVACLDWEKREMEFAFLKYWNEMWFQLLVPWMSPSRGAKKISVTEIVLFSVVWTNVMVISHAD